MLQFEHNYKSEKVLQNRSHFAPSRWVVKGSFSQHGIKIEKFSRDLPLEGTFTPWKLNITHMGKTRTSSYWCRRARTFWKKRAIKLRHRKPGSNRWWQWQVWGNNDTSVIEAMAAGGVPGGGENPMLSDRNRAPYESRVCGAWEDK